MASHTGANKLAPEPSALLAAVTKVTAEAHRQLGSISLGDAARVAEIADTGDGEAASAALSQVSIPGMGQQRDRMGDQAFAAHLRATADRVAEESQQAA